jgi:hypothetical protein
MMTRQLVLAALMLGATIAHADERGVVPLTEMHRETTAQGPPCEDETGRLFRDGPTAFVDGLRPQGYCGPPGWREERALRIEAERRYQFDPRR